LPVAVAVVAHGVAVVAVVVAFSPTLAGVRSQLPQRQQSRSEPVVHLRPAGQTRPLTQLS